MLPPKQQSAEQGVGSVVISMHGGGGVGKELTNSFVDSREAFDVRERNAGHTHRVHSIVSMRAFFSYLER